MGSKKALLIMDRILNVIQESLADIRNPRFYETERGFQGEFLSILGRKLSSLSWNDAIVEQEYQKRMRDHGFRIRPDIIIHIPFDESLHSARTEGNFVVFELKLNASKTDALQDLEKLSEMCEVLEYPLGIFININSTETYLNQYQGTQQEKLHAFAVSLDDDQVKIQYEHAS